jgi:hypothetical protein
MLIVALFTLASGEDPMSHFTPRRRSPRFALRLVVLMAGIGVVAAIGPVGAGGVPGAAARTASQRDCNSDLAKANASLARALRLRTAARQGELILIPGGEPGGFYPISTKSYSDYLTLELLSGKITRAELRKFIAFLSRRRAATIKALTELVDDLHKERNAIRDSCASGNNPKPAPTPEGAFPGGTATTMTFTVGGATVTTDLKTNKQSTEPTVMGSSPSSLSGSVSLNGTLPPGWTIVVFHNGTADIVLNSPTGGDFTLKAISPAFDAGTRPAAYVCSTPVPPVCGSPSAQADISVDWNP